MSGRKQVSWLWANVRASVYADSAGLPGRRPHAVGRGLRFCWSFALGTASNRRALREAA